MKTKEELNALKEEVKNLNEKLRELSEDELVQVTGGYWPGIAYVCQMGCTKDPAECFIAQNAPTECPTLKQSQKIETEVKIL